MLVHATPPNALWPNCAKTTPPLKCMVPADRLSANAPHIETLQAHGLHYLLGVKEGDHAFVFHQVQAAEHAGRVTHSERHDRAAGLVHRCRLVNDVPLNASNAEVRVNFIAYWEICYRTLFLSHFEIDT
jgi:hypothetical protein